MNVVTREGIEDVNADDANSAAAVRECTTALSMGGCV
jgi:hypothetical protein